MSQPETAPLRAWPMWIIVALCLIGVAIGVYMTHHHEASVYGGSEIALWGCAEAEGVSCDIVNTSEWSELFGVPQFTWAIPAYLLIAGLAALAAIGRFGAVPLVFVLGLGSFAYSMFLGYISLVELRTICLWCTRLYAINLAIPILALVAGVRRAPMPDTTLLSGSFGAYLTFALVAIGGQQAYRATLLDGAPVLTAALPAEAPATASSADVTPDKDPVGTFVTREWDVQSEDGNPAKLTVSGDDPWKGNPEASVVIVEFADFECGFCKRTGGELKRLLAAYGDRVAVVYKHYPMDSRCNEGVKSVKHRDACMAAEVGECARQQGVFWAFHDLAFKNQHELGAEELAQYFTKAGGDLAKLDQCMAAGGGKAKVKADTTVGAGLELHGTPRVFIDGTIYRGGSSAEVMARAVEVALGANAADANAAAAKLRTEVVIPTEIPADVPPMRAVRYGELAFSIDTFEAGVRDGKAVSGKREIPGVQMSWFAARDACQAAGKRLCSEREWVSACQGALAIDDDNDGAYADDLIEGTTYPYDDLHDPRRCWDGRPSEGHRPVYTGEMPGCVSKDGVYDLTGNVEEWVGLTPETAVLVGGAFDTSKDFARCYRRNDTFGPGYANIRTGFRCCTD